MKEAPGQWNFGCRHAEKLEFWRRRIEDYRARGRRMVVWGAGSKGVTFLNMLGIDRSVIPFVIDVNPRKAGLYVPRTGQEVVAPGFLKDNPPDVILVPNSAYLGEIGDLLREMRIAAELVAV